MRQLVPPAAVPVSTSPMPSSGTGVCDQGAWVRSGGAKGSALGGACGLGGAGGGAGPGAGVAGPGSCGAAQAAVEGDQREQPCPVQPWCGYFPAAFRVTSRW